MSSDQSNRPIQPNVPSRHPLQQKWVYGRKGANSFESITSSLCQEEDYPRNENGNKNWPKPC